MSPLPITLVGATGLTGSATLNALLQTQTVPFRITTIARKPIHPGSASHPETRFSHNLVSDLFTAPSSKVADKGGVYISCLGTTRATAGGIEAQEKLDLGLNRDLARKAKEDGAKGIILVSSAGTSAGSKLPYGRMKGQLQEDVKAMDFDSCVILRPAMLLGARNESRPAEYVAQTLFRGLRSVGLPMSSLCVDADDVGACIAHFAANLPSEKVTIVENAQIIQIAKEWREANGQAKH